MIVFSIKWLQKAEKVVTNDLTHRRPKPLTARVAACPAERPRLERDDINLEGVPLLRSTFPIVVPSLSWQNDRLHHENGTHKGIFLTWRVSPGSAPLTKTGSQIGLPEVTPGTW